MSDTDGTSFLDAALDARLVRHFKRERLVNAVQEIGMGKYQRMLLAFTCFGFFIDNMWLMVTAQMFILAGIVQFKDGFSIEGHFLELVLTISLLVVVVIEDTFGNTRGWSIITGVVGNLPGDLALFLDLVPDSHKSLLTTHSSWSIFGRLFGILVAFLLIFLFPHKEGWKYFLCATICLKLTLHTLRGWFPLYEPPTHLLACDHDAQAIEVLDKVAAYNGSSNHLTLEILWAAGLPTGKMRYTDIFPLLYKACSKFDGFKPLFDRGIFVMLTSFSIILWAFIRFVCPPIVKFVLL